ncbi:MAG TPA: PD-(D/E)XK nuclease domain-containing protein, partial [Myxococcota bacterium]|nr:PD-(D/E)XK nuclease domain-containing protein [Myxococcota bacterium]
TAKSASTGKRILDPLHRAILDGDVPTLQKLLGALVLRHVSFHDVTETQAETFYHAFVLGLLISMEKTHFVRSNREVGAGRADVQIIPKEAGKPGAILEFKKQSGKGSLFYHAGAALRQIQKQGYDAELVAAGATPIQKIGICFAGKEVVVRGA